MSLVIRLTALALALTILTGGECQKQKQPSGPRNTGLPTTTMRLGSEQFTLEIAADATSREIGLMNRTSMPEDQGMIFVFPEEQRLGFWMKNTHIPLDIVYVNETGTVVSVHSMKPLDLTTIPSAGPAKFAIELNLGAAARAGVQRGMKLDIPPSASSPK